MKKSDLSSEQKSFFSLFRGRKQRANRRESDNKAALSYLESNEVMEILRAGNPQEIPPRLYDLYVLHREIRRAKPKVVLEFGSGFSTLIIAHALFQNAEEERAAKGEIAKPGKCWTLDANSAWMENTKQKIPVPLADFVDIRYCQSSVTILNGQLCHCFDKLPNINPEFVYLDGPSARDVQGTQYGLGFTLESGGHRRSISADLLLLEPALCRNFRMIIDGRYENAVFLRTNLRREYRIQYDKIHDFWTFHLIE